MRSGEARTAPRARQHLYARTTHCPEAHAGACSPSLHGTIFFPRRFAGRLIGFFASSSQQSSAVLHATAGASGAAAAGDGDAEGGAPDEADAAGGAEAGAPLSTGATGGALATVTTAGAALGADGLSFAAQATATIGTIERPRTRAAVIAPS
jgi:hypothetical protein